MKKLILPVILCLSIQVVYSQSPNTILVKAGEDFSKVIPLNERYRYTEFHDGLLHYPQGKKSSVLKLNYNLVFGAVQFLDDKGDTLFIAEDSNIFKYVQIQRDLYYHDFRDGYFEILTRNAPVKLIAQLKWKVVRKEIVVENGYGTSASVSNTEYSSRRSSDINNFVQNENTLFGKDLSYFLLGKKEKIYKANKNGFLKIFYDHKQKINLYIKEQNIDFLKEEDLKKLLEFCNNL